MEEIYIGQDWELRGCKKCNRARFHEPNMFGMWSCVECGATRE